MAPAAPRLIQEKCQSSVRWVVLVLACWMMVGSYYCFDIPAALKTQIDDYMGDPSDYEIKFGLLYTLYSAPNVILPFFGGYLVDKMGTRLCLLLFCGLISLGQVIFTLGLQAKSWPIIFLGRLVFGFGGESFTVANSALLSEWFKGRELAFAFGVNLAISKLGSVFNNLLSPVLAEDVGVIFALWFGAALCGLSLLCVFFTIPIDRAVEHRIALAKGYTPLALVSSVTTDSVEMPPPVDNSAPKVEASLRDVLVLKHIFWVLVIACMVVYGCILPFNNISSSLLLERDYFQLPGDACQLVNPLLCQSTSNPPNSACPSSRWYQPPLPLNATVDAKVYNPLEAGDIDCADNAWKDGCTAEYCTRLQRAESQASIIMSIPYIISAVLAPPLGYAIDLYGYRAVISLLAPLLLLVVHSLLGYTEITPVLPLIGQGFAYTGFVSVLWPSVPLVVPVQVTGLAFGVVASMQNFACAVIPLVVAAIYTDSGDRYIPNVELLFALLAVLGTVVGVYMNYYDFYYGDSVLNSPCLLDQDEAGAEGEEMKMDKGLFSASAAREEDSEETTGQAGETLQARLLSGEERSRDRMVSANSQRSRHSNTGEEGAGGKRGASFTSYEEVMRGGGYRTVTAAGRRSHSKQTDGIHIQRG